MHCECCISGCPSCQPSVSCPACNGKGYHLYEFNPDTGEDIREYEDIEEWKKLPLNRRDIERCEECGGEGNILPENINPKNF